MRPARDEWAYQGETLLRLARLQLIPSAHAQLLLDEWYGGGVFTCADALHGLADSIRAQLRRSLIAASQPISTPRTARPAR